MTVYRVSQWLYTQMRLFRRGCGQWTIKSVWLYVICNCHNDYTFRCVSFAVVEHNQQLSQYDYDVCHNDYTLRVFRFLRLFCNGWADLGSNTAASCWRRRQFPRIEDTECEPVISRCPSFMANLSTVGLSQLPPMLRCLLKCSSKGSWHNFSLNK